MVVGFVFSFFSPTKLPVAIKASRESVIYPVVWFGDSNVANLTINIYNVANVTININKQNANPPALEP